MVHLIAQRNRNKEPAALKVTPKGDPALKFACGLGVANKLIPECAASNVQG
jgi:hypothetical protein